MTEIIDDFRSEKQSPFAKKSFRQFLLALQLLIIPILLTTILTGFLKKVELLNFVLIGLILMSFIVSLVGFVNAIKSLSKKENSSKKYLGLVGNLLFVAMFIVLIAQNIRDLYEFLE